MTVRIWINGASHELPEPVTVTEVLLALDAPASGVAVAVDDELVPKTDWARHRLRAEARVEVLTAVQGG
ncbi:sulfur carrier protein ThiS [Pseudonocardia sp.]|uniref:sulfur carrier protein ThiS n=1 Tax=Pseudonocardia sp. TaxID=60912 RepID=UPI002F403E1E